MIGLDKHASVDILWLIPVILAEYFEIWIIESNLIKELVILPDVG